MIKTYFKTAWRLLLREKTSSLINVIGLAVGMTVSALVILWVQQELTFDRFYSKTARIYEVYNRGDFNHKTWAWSGQANPLTAILKKDYPDLESITRYNNSSLTISVGDKTLKNEGAFVDSTFFDLFDFPGIQENKRQMFSTPKSIILTASFAKKLFGNTENIIGKTVKIDSADMLSITSIIPDIPKNSRFRDINYFIPWPYFESTLLGKQMAMSWTAFKAPVFVLLKPMVSVKSAESKISQLLLNLGVSKNKLFLFPANKWHLYTKQENGDFTGGRIDMVRLFMLIGLVTLLIACINFINLSTAKSERRAKEVSIRKIIGAQKKTLIIQFLLESFLLTLISAFIAIAILLLILPFFNSLLNTYISLHLSDQSLWIGAIIFIMFTSLFAGLYPAFFLSSFQPLNVLKKVFKYRENAISLRKILIIIQFTSTIILIIATFVIHKQINYAKKREKGYDMQHLISLPLNSNRKNHFENIRQDLLNSGAVISLTRTSGTITQQTFGATNFSWPGSTQDDLNKAFVALTSDASFKSTMGVRLLEGRDIDIEKYPTDSNALLLNESAVKATNLTNPIGAIIRNGKQQWHVVGVVSDFIFYSPYAAINPLFILGSGNWFNYLYIKLDPKKDLANSLNTIQTVFKKYDPVEPVDYNFTDEAYQKNFENEQRTATLVLLFSTATVLISSLGLFGLITYVMERRKKEISIRKVLGASLPNIAALLSKEFIALILLAFIIASPIVYWAMEKWLQNFAYRIIIPCYAFIYAIILTISIVLLILGMQIIKAAIAKPIDSLREE